jgi:hypothetical protein
MVKIPVQEQQVRSGIGLSPMVDSERVFSRMNEPCDVLDGGHPRRKIEPVKLAKQLQLRR